VGTGNHLSIYLGQNIIVGGLFIQLIFLGAFIRVATFFQIHLWKVPATRTLETPWEKNMAALYVCSILILVRSMFRVMDCLQGFSKYVLSHEVFLYVFDACLMLSVMLILKWYHSSQIHSSIQGGSYVRGIQMIHDAM